MQAPNGKMRLTDVLDSEGVLRLVQSIPSQNSKLLKAFIYCHYVNIV